MFKKLVFECFVTRIVPRLFKENTVFLQNKHFLWKRTTHKQNALTVIYQVKLGEVIYLDIVERRSCFYRVVSICCLMNSGNVLKAV